MQPSKRLGLWCGGQKKRRQSLATADKVRLQSYSISLTLITIYFKNLTIKLHALYALNTRQILCQSDIIYYMIYKIIFYA